MWADQTVEEPAAQLDLLRRRVLNVVGHELRTPITTLRGLADQLYRTLAPEGAVEVHDAIRRTVRRVEGLVDSLLAALEVTVVLKSGDATELVKALRGDGKPATRSA